MENSLVTAYGFNKDRERIEHLKWICDLCCVVISKLVSAQSSGKKNNWKCDGQELFERKRAVYFLLHYSRKRFFMEGFEPEIYFVAITYGNLRRLSSCLHAGNEIGRGYCL